MNVIELMVEEKQAGHRIDKMLSMVHADWSRTQIQQWLKQGYIFVNGEVVKPNFKVKKGDRVIVEEPAPEQLELVPEPIPLEIYYEDEDVLIVDKPKGMVVHPAPGHTSGTLVNGLLYHCQQLSTINGIVRPGIVHRIDKDTSGLLMVAKNNRSHQLLVQQLMEKSVTRIYTALVHGHIPHDKGTIDAPIGRNPKDRQSMAVVDNGKEAVTHFQVLERIGNDYTLVTCRLETGRTHQIRVHMQYIGYPLVGDPKYGPKKALVHDGQVLHAGTLGFRHPTTGEYKEFQAPLPHAFEQLLMSLRKEKH